MPRPPTEHGIEPDITLAIAQVGLVVIGLLLALPALIVAVPLGYLVDQRGWRRWPALLGGAAATAVLVAFGAWHAYAATWIEIWSHVRFHRRMHWVDLLGMVPLALPAGVTTGSALPTVVHHRNEHEATRHHRELSNRRRSRTQASRRISSAPWSEPADRTVLGLRIDGAIPDWQTRSGLRSYVAPAADVWLRQALILGETGSGKTVTATILASEALRIGWDVYWIDGKADTSTRDAFLAAATAAGIDARDGATAAVDGWRGGPEAIINRLLATQVFTEPYYEGVARTVLRAAVGGRAPTSLAELVRRIDKKVLMRAARDRELAEVVRDFPDREIFGVRSRYEGISWAVGSALDGAWSYEDVRAAYVPVGRPENRNQAAEVGAFLLEDLLHWAMARKDRARKALVIVDEFSKLSSRPDAAVDLVERVRASGVGVVLIGQTWASLGPDDAVRHRLAGTT